MNADPQADGPQATLAEMRATIDNVDAALVHMLAERFRCTQAVGRLKAAHGLPPADPAREKQQIARLRRLAQDAQLDPDFAEKFLNFIIREVIRHHEMLAAETRSRPAIPAGAGTAGLEENPRKAAPIKDGPGEDGIDAGISDGLDRDPILGSDDDMPHQMG